VYNITSAAWTFVSSLDIWGLPTTGYHSTYGGGGYIAEFVVNYNISKIILKDLYKYIWINRNTRAVFKEKTRTSRQLTLYCTLIDLSYTVHFPNLRSNYCHLHWELNIYRNILCHPISMFCKNLKTEIIIFCHTWFIFF
jgi:hypothetical protein